MVWVGLSELLHGRGPLVTAARWEACHLADPKLQSDAELAIQQVQVATQLSLRQVVLCIVSLVEEGPFPSGLGRTLCDLPLGLPSEITIKRAAPLVWPLTFDALNFFGRQLVHSGADYLRDVQVLESQGTPRRLNYSARSIEAFVSRRARAAASAERAFVAEQQQLGDTFDPSAIQRREFAYIIMNEAAGLLALWGTGYQADALAVGSSALRSALWLWLEDDDRSLVLARSVLEQTARLRTWRLKPDRAQRLEDRSDRTTPRDWLEDAGWRRLSVLTAA